MRLWKGICVGGLRPPKKAKQAQSTRRDENEAGRKDNRLIFSMKAVASPDHIGDEHDDEGGGRQRLYVMGVPNGHELWKKGYAAKNRIRFREAIDRVVMLADGLLFLAKKVQHGGSINREIKKQKYSIVWSILDDKKICKKPLFGCDEVA